MKKNWSSLFMILKIALTYVGAVIGAGFASGQEIFEFFVQYGDKGMIGLFGAGVLFILGGIIFLKLAQHFNINTYYEIFYRILGKRSGFIVDVIYILFILGSVSVMLAGSGTIFQETFGVRYSVGVLITLLVVIITIFAGVKGILMVNTFLIPILMLVIIYTCLSYLGSDLIETIGTLSPIRTFPWYLSGMMYVSFNVFLSMALLVTIGSKVKERRSLTLGGFLGGLLLMILLLMMGYTMISFFSEISYVEMPMLIIASYSGDVLHIIYTIGLWFAMITTAVAHVYAFIQRVSPLLRLSYYNSAMLTVVIVLPLTRFGFANLVRYLYPLYGLVALGILVMMIVKSVRGY
ncbi:MAG: hypothetical protein KAX49_10560 [Halanaerobiales bacterium]|nr:hypothetical protein [Halanaerobiales bacterium]